MKHELVDGLVSGALYDFMGFLTTRKTVVRVSRHHDVYGIMEAYKEFSNIKNIKHKPRIDWDAISIGRYLTKKQKKRKKNV